MGKTVFPSWWGVGLGGDMQVLAGNNDVANANHSVLDGWKDASVLSFQFELGMCTTLAL